MNNNRPAELELHPLTGKQGATPLTSEQKNTWQLIVRLYHLSKQSFASSTEIVNNLVQIFKNHSPTSPRTAEEVFNCVKDYTWTQDRFSATDRVIAKTIMLLTDPNGNNEGDYESDYRADRITPNLSAIKTLAVNQQLTTLEISLAIVGMLREDRTGERIRNILLSQNCQYAHRIATFIQQNSQALSFQELVIALDKNIDSLPDTLELLQQYWISSEKPLTVSEIPIVFHIDLTERRHVLDALVSLNRQDILVYDTRHLIGKYPYLSRVMSEIIIALKQAELLLTPGTIAKNTRALDLYISNAEDPSLRIERCNALYSKMREEPLNQDRFQSLLATQANENMPSTLNGIGIYSSITTSSTRVKPPMP